MIISNEMLVQDLLLGWRNSDAKINPVPEINVLWGLVAVLPSALLPSAV